MIRTACLYVLTDFPLEARRESGFNFKLWQVQRGLHPSDFKPMPAVGAGVFELRVHVLGEWRVIYVAKIKDAVYVLHAFHKKHRKPARKTSSWQRGDTSR